MNKNIILSGSKILSDSSKGKDDKKYQQTTKNLNININSNTNMDFSNNSYNYNYNNDKIKSSILNKV